MAFNELAVAAKVEGYIEDDIETVRMFRENAACILENTFIVTAFDEEQVTSLI